MPVGGCGLAADNFSRCQVLGGGNAQFCAGLAHCKSGKIRKGENPLSINSIFLVRSTQPETHSVRAALAEFGVVPYRDYIFGARQGINSVRQITSVSNQTGSAKDADGTCTFPDSGQDAPSFRRAVTCQPGTVDSLTSGATFTPAAPTKPATSGKDGQLYVDAKPMRYDMQSIVSSSSDLVNSSSGQVKVAVGIQAKDVPSLTAELKLAKADGAQVALLTEEDWGNAPEPLDGPHVTGLRAAAKALSLFVIAPFRLALGPGRNFNAAVVISPEGELLNSTAGVPYYQKVMPVLEYPVPATPSLPNDLPEGVTPGQVGVQAWDLPGIGRIASECSHRRCSSRPLLL